MIYFTLYLYSLRKVINLKRNKKITKILAFLVFQVVFIFITIPFFIFWGPFENIKKTMVGASMTTLSHQYIAKKILSQDRIDEILSENKFDIKKQKNLEKIKNNIKNRIKKTSIEKYSISSKRFKGYVLIIDDPSKIKVGYSGKIGLEGETTSKIAERNKAIAAVNGGAFAYNEQEESWVSSGAKPMGILISNGRNICKSVGRDSQMYVMAFTEDGVLLVGNYNFKELESLKVRDAISFGPPIVIDGKGTVVKGDGGWGIAPRTAIGQRKDGSIILLVIDGRQPSSYGASLKDLQDIMIQFAAYNATNLDGGSSSTMYYKGDILNNPSDPLGERTVPSIVYVEK